MRNSASLLCLLAVALAGCADRGADGGAAQVAQWNQEPPIAAPWLRERLPSGVLAYQRIPHPLGLLATPKGNMLDAALGSEANARNLIEIRRGVSENVLGTLGVLTDPRIGLLADDLRSPVEVAVFGLPSPSALVAATLDLSSNAELEQAVADLAQAEPPVALAGPLDADGTSRLTGLPVPAFVHFDASSGRLLIGVGPNVTQSAFTQTVTSLPSGAEHPMHALERRIDASGQGWFSWVDTSTALPLAQAFMPPGPVSMIRRAGLDALRAIALGAGSANGKGRLSVLLDVGSGNAQRPYPVISNAVAATSVGEPDAALLLSIPDAAEFTRLEALALDAVPAGSGGRWQDAKTAFRELTGITVQDLLAALGPELLLMFDGAGDYGAVRVRDAALFDELVASVAETTGQTPTEHEFGGRTIHHWRPPSLIAAATGDAADGGAAAAASLLGRTRDHWYWLRDDEYLYFAGIPQPLMDRIRMGADTSVGEWLTETQRMDTSSSLFAATGAVDKLPRRTYHVYLDVMQALADFSSADYDAWAMPTAGQLGLPEQGAIGMSLNLGEPYLSLELSYEAQPGELLFGAGGIGPIAMAGIVAAVAIPAYQDYTVRASVAAGLAQARATQDLVAERYASSERFPNADEVGALARPDVAGPVASIIVEPDTGVVVLSFEPGTIPDAGGIRLEPGVEADGRVTWRCGGSIAERYVPAACR